MDIAFSSKELKQLSENHKTALKILGKLCAAKLKIRLSQIEAVDCVGQLQLGRPHTLTGDRKGQFALDLHGGSRLVFESNHTEQPLLDDGALDWRRVTKVKIVFIGDYHD